MSIYLPLGIGLFQAQNQQLAIVSEQQTQLIHFDGSRKLYTPYKGGLGVFKYLFYRFRDWLSRATNLGMYEGFVFAGLVLQVSLSLPAFTGPRIENSLTHFKTTVSVTIYCLSRKFNYYGIIGETVDPGQCRRGWEWYTCLHLTAEVKLITPSGSLQSSGNSCGTTSSVPTSSGRFAWSTTSITGACKPLSLLLLGKSYSNSSLQAPPFSRLGSLVPQPLPTFTSAISFIFNPRPSLNLRSATHSPTFNSLHTPSSFDITNHTSQPSGNSSLARRCLQQ